MAEARKAKKAKSTTDRVDVHTLLGADQRKYMDDLSRYAGFSKAKCYRWAIDWFIASFREDFRRAYGVPLTSARLRELDLDQLYVILSRRQERKHQSMNP